ncbi:MAG: YidC/Oxa1 family membrane protein insertase, partial [Chloroflexota bacterium]
VFTVVTRMLLYPLTLQQQRSMRKQQALQPRIKKLQEKYKNDREKLAQEQMKLFQEEGINPLAGCLPMFIQIPIFLGLYQAIIYSLAATPLQLIDMSGRLLIPGLATEVPLNNFWMGLDLTLSPTENPMYALALPILVMATTWAQTKLTMPNMNNDDKSTKGSDSGGAMDQAQAMTRSMTTIMPLMLGFFSLQFSVGISIYFITSNLIGAFQYGFIGRRHKEQLDREAEAAEAAAEAEAEGGKRSKKKGKARAKKATS